MVLSPGCDSLGSGYFPDHYGEKTMVATYEKSSRNKDLSSSTDIKKAGVAPGLLPLPGAARQAYSSTSLLA
jgi:hypothetical protein